MKKKHYEAIAEVLKIVHDKYYISDSARYLIATLLAEYFTSDNKNFDRVRFLTACGIDQL